MTKYGFETLEIGDSVSLYGNPSAIRSTASMWGRRHAIWLKTQKAPDGATVVTRVAVPTGSKRKRKLSIEDRLKHLEDGQRFVAIMVTKIHKLLDK